MVCACEVWTSSTKKMPVLNIPNKHLLVPTVPHYAHTLIQGILVEQRGMSRLEDDETATICISCERQLKKSKIPSFALANNMWIGKVPMELAVLTPRENPCRKMLPSGVCGEIVSETERSKDMVTVKYKLRNEGKCFNILSEYRRHCQPGGSHHYASKLSIAVCHDRHHYNRTTEPSREDNAWIFACKTITNQGWSEMVEIK